MQTKATVILLLLTLFAVGCESAKKQSSQDDSQAVSLQAQLEMLQRENRTLKNDLKELQQKMVNLQGMDRYRLDYVTQVDSIEFGRFTKPFDEDEDGGDDGVNIYLVLKDQQGDVIKAAGKVHIEIWDLAQPDGERLFDSKSIELKDVGKYWLPGFGGNHYKFILPWPNGQCPKHSNLTLKLTFTDVLTGEVFELQKTLSVSTC